MYVVCGRNVAIGAYATMDAAITSVHQSITGLVTTLSGPHYWEGVAPDGTRFTAVELCQASPAAAPTPLFRERPAARRKVTTT